MKKLVLLGLLFIWLIGCIGYCPSEPYYYDYYEPYYYYYEPWSYHYGYYPYFYYGPIIH